MEAVEGFEPPEELRCTVDAGDGEDTEEERKKKDLEKYDFNGNLKASWHVHILSCISIYIKRGLIP